MYRWINTDAHAYGNFVSVVKLLRIRRYVATSARCTQDTRTESTTKSCHLHPVYVTFSRVHQLTGSSMLLLHLVFPYAALKTVLQYDWPVHLNYIMFYSYSCCFKNSETYRPYMYISVHTDTYLCDIFSIRLLLIFMVSLENKTFDSCWHV